MFSKRSFLDLGQNYNDFLQSVSCVAEVEYQIYKKNLIGLTLASRFTTSENEHFVPVLKAYMLRPLCGLNLEKINFERPIL